MILKDQVLLKFDVADSNNILIPSNVEIKNINDELDLTLGFSSKLIGKVSNIRRQKDNMIADIQLFSDVYKNKIFRSKFLSEDLIRKEPDDFNKVISMKFLSIGAIPKERDVYR